MRTGRRRDVPAPRKVPIRDESIRLGQFLKLADLVDTGSDAKPLLADGLVTVNGEVKQNGNTSQFIFTPEEQIEYAASILTIETGDVFSCGTCGGVGQGTNTFLQPGDVMETEVESLGKMRNRFVAETA